MRFDPSEVVAQIMLETLACAGTRRRKGVGEMETGLVNLAIAFIEAISMRKDDKPIRC